jgi:bacteriocin biosynthesis cyclodehydratase domain-containing protein
VSLRRPRFRVDQHVSTVEGAGTFLLSETTPTVLNGRLYEAICPLIDGQRTVDDIIEALRGSVSIAEIYFALGTLEKQGYIEQADDATPDATAGFWRALGSDATSATSRLATTPLRLVTVGAVDEAPARRALQSVGLHLSADATDVIVVTDDYRNDGIDAIDAEVRLSGGTLLLVKPVGWIPWLGPILPADQGCWCCMVDRIRMNYATDTFVEERIGQVPVTSRAALPGSIDAALTRFAIEVAKWVVLDEESPLLNTVVTMPLNDIEQTQHSIPRRPQCRRCGEPENQEREPEPLVLRSTPLLQSVDGGHRTATAEDTLSKYAHLVSPITGIVSTLERVSPPDNPVVHAYSANHNWATHPDSLSFLKQTLRSKSGGKGTTDAQARVGAMAEAFERYSGVFRGDEIRRRAYLEDFGDAGVHPHDILLFSDSQYQRRREINAEGNAFQMISEPFDVTQPAHFSPVWAPTTEEWKWVPTGLLYYSYSKVVSHDTPNRMAYYADSNGCASGNTLEEATLQALLELVERDAVATWWYNEVPRPAVDLATVASPYLDDLQDWIAGEGRDLWVLDITNDIGIPAFAAFSRKTAPDENGAEQLVVGFGAHLDPRIGIMRAITEVNQFFASLYALEDNDLRRAFDPGAVEWWETASVENKPYAAPAHDLPLVKASDLVDLSSADLLNEVQTTIDRIEARGLEVLLLDQTRKEAGFPVVKAIVPGMRHFWSRHAPGRLYDVPVNLGWLKEARNESELNPTPVFF